MGGPASLTAFAAALVPAAVLSIWLWVIDRGRTTPELMGQSLTLGALMTPAVLLPAWLFGWMVSDVASGSGFGSLDPDLIRAAFAAPLLEEAGRLCIVVFVLARHEDFRADGFVPVAGWASLGFAGVENVGYLLLEKEWGVLAVLRATTSVPTHLVLGLVMGSFLAAHARTGRPAFRLLAYGVPVVLHGLFNATAFGAANDAPIGFLLVLSILGAVATRSLRGLDTSDDEAHPRRYDRVVGFVLGACFLLVGILIVAAAILGRVWGVDPLEQGLMLFAARAILPTAFGIAAVRAARRTPKVSFPQRCADDLG